MAVTLTEAAARHVDRYIARRGKGVGVRLGVKTTGCSGLAYKLEYADDVAPEDMVFEGHGVKVLVDPKSLPYIDGTELDFVREGLNEGFKFTTRARKTAAVAASRSGSRGPFFLAARCASCVGRRLGSTSICHEDRRRRLRAVRPAAALRAGPRADRRALEGAAVARCIRTAHAEGTASQRVAMQWAVRVNEAYQRLKDPLRRAAYLCELRGAPIDAETNTAMPADFLLQQMQWREALEDAERRRRRSTR